MSLALLKRPAWPYSGWTKEDSRTGAPCIFMLPIKWSMRATYLARRSLVP